MQTNPSSKQNSNAQRRVLINSLTLIALGLSILFLNSWDNLFVRASIGLFWGTFFLVLNGPEAIKTLRSIAKKNDTRRTSYRVSPQR